MKVEIKARMLTAGNRSLYLEYYETGFRKRENLHLYLIPDDAPNARKLNEQTLRKAQEIQAQRILTPPSFEKKEKREENEQTKTMTMTWLGWCDDYVRCAMTDGNCKKMIQHKDVVRRRIEAYLKRAKKTDVLLKDVDRDLVSGLFGYMRSYRNRKQIRTNGGRLAAYTLVLFEETVKAIFNKAVRDGLIAYNPIQDLSKEERFHAPDKHREYLTADELKRFLSVEPQTFMEEVVQRAFGFSCMTGLRLGDMQRLRWSDIKDVNGVLMVSLIQHKTKRPVAVPLNALAISLLPPRPEDGKDGIIFPLVKKPDNVAKYVRRIKNKAGIEKDFTYHSSRHSAATLAITAGAELYSVSKILGHGSIASTQVYAKVNMEKKVEAMNLTNGVF
ncbi:site-specific integrase [Bacteroides caecicola]|uniref:site-specific integrase n=1 Tax=Bacteroides caecicola TaxID=1462569 RepID=UPI0015AAFEFB|nr:site-specific integrase [Bacteroides caecicola]MCL1625826.1 site-specific integrase [Bacteroides caecicola]